MREFNLEEAKAGKPVCTRDGKAARIICWDRSGNFPIVALVYDEKMDFEDAVFYTRAGRWEPAVEGDFDLMMLPEKKKGWINLGRHINGTVYAGSRIFETKEEAYQYGIGTDCFTTIKIEWEE